MLIKSYIDPLRLMGRALLIQLATFTNAVLAGVSGGKLSGLWYAMLQYTKKVIEL